MVRKILEYLARKISGRHPLPEQILAFESFSWAVTCSRLYITKETYNLVVRSKRPGLSKIILPEIAILYQGRYLRRWTRHLREFNFSGEDAKLLASATFGFDLETRTLGTEIVMTFDTNLIRKFNAHLGDIDGKFHKMILSLDAPYCYAKLPKVMKPDQVLNLFSPA